MTDLDSKQASVHSKGNVGRVLDGLLFVIAGILFGIVAYKSEIISWYRIQEMFRFQSFHMYGVIASAVMVAALSIWLLRRSQAKTLFGDPIELKPKSPTVISNLLGGIIFGFGWAMTGACPGPMFTLIGHGVWSILLVIGSAVLGTYTYGLLRAKLPH